MSDLKGGHSAGENSTRFLDGELKFGCREGSSKINTRQFLEDSKCVVGIFEKMGKVFAPLKYDMSGNITKISNKYSSDEGAHEFLDDMILAEKVEEGNVTIDALQWLRRGLHFIARFFECIIDDADAGSDRQDLKPFFRTAYQEVLERYHGWMGVQLFNVYFHTIGQKMAARCRDLTLVNHCHSFMNNLGRSTRFQWSSKTTPLLTRPQIGPKQLYGKSIAIKTDLQQILIVLKVMCRFAPNRKELFRILSSGKTCKDELVLQDIRAFKTNLLVCVQLLITFYNEHNLENHAKV